MSEPTRPPEMELIESLRKASRPAMSVRKAAEAASISEGRWRSLAKGTHQVSKGTAVPTRAPADTLARMARAVGATAEQLREVGRGDAADELGFQQDVLFPAPAAPPRSADFNRAVELARQIVNAPTTPHDEHFNRAERLLSHAHESVRHGHYLSAIHSLEGVESTIELLIDRVTGSAIRQREEQLNDLETEAPAGASGQENQKQEVKPEPPSTIETALGDYWAESVDWSTIRTPADVQRLVLELAEEALKMHGQVDLDLNDFAAKIRNYADALRREQDAEQSDEVNEVTQSHFDLAARTVDDEGKPI